MTPDYKYCASILRAKAGSFWLHYTEREQLIRQAELLEAQDTRADWKDRSLKTDSGDVAK